MYVASFVLNVAWRFTYKH